MRRRFVLDTNIYIHSFRDPVANTELVRFHESAGAGEYLSSVVVQELRAGTRALADRRRLERHLIDHFIRVGRVVTPTATAWAAAGDVLAALRAREGLQLGGVSKALGNDILLAMSCREAGLMLVTDNVRDFARIAAVMKFDYTTRWPGM